MEISEFSPDPKTLEFCVQKLQSAEVDKFELYWERASQLGIEIKEGKLDHFSRATDQGLAIRVLKNQRAGFAYTIDLSRRAIEQAIGTALEISTLMPSDPLLDLPPFGSALFPNVETYDAGGLNLPMERKLDMARQLEADTLRHDPRIKRVRTTGLNEVSAECVMADSNGEMIGHRHTLYSAQVTCVAEDGSEAEMGSEGQYAHFLDQLPMGEVSTRAAANALELLHAGKAPTMTCPAVFKSSVVADLVGFLAASFSAENVDKNFSLLAGKKGERVFAERVSIVDDGALGNGIATAPFDGEGTPMRTTRLVEDGVLINYLYDSYYGRKHGTASTGNSRRGSIKSAPGIGPTNLFLRAGKSAQNALVTQAANGIFITDLMGLHTANPVTGEFSVGASGRLIENGMLTRPVKGFAVAGNLLDLFKRVTAVGSDLRFWGPIGAPSLLVDGLNVSGT